jgi:hypothetical protein
VREIEESLCLRESESERGSEGEDGDIEERERKIREED